MWLSALEDEFYLLFFFIWNNTLQMQIPRVKSGSVEKESRAFASHHNVIDHEWIYSKKELIIPDGN